MSTETATTTKVVTDLVRLSYANVWVPTSMDENQEKKYSTTILIPKTDEGTMSKIRAAMAAAEEAGKSILVGKDNKPLPKNKFHQLLKDGDEMDNPDPNYAGCYYLNAKSKTKPGIVGMERDEAGKLKPITDESQVYSGCYARVSINFFAFNKAGKFGISAGLQNIQKVKDGEAFAGRSNADTDFGDDYTGDNSADDLL